MAPAMHPIASRRVAGKRPTLILNLTAAGILPIPSGNLPLPPVVSIRVSAVDKSLQPNEGMFTGSDVALPKTLLHAAALQSGHCSSPQPLPSGGEKLSYARALASSPYSMQTSMQPTSRSPTPPNITNFRDRCHRCLALDHRVKMCRDPIRCRRCWGWGHNKHTCKTVLYSTGPTAIAHHASTPESPPSPPPLFPQPSPVQQLPASMASFIPVPIELSSSEEVDLNLRAASSPPANASALPVHEDVEDVIMEEEEDPDEVEFESGEEATDWDSDPFMLPPSPPTRRRSHSNVFMPFVDLDHFQNLAFAYVNPPHPSPQAMIRRALLSGARNPQVAIRASSQGARLVVFSSTYEREISVPLSPFNCPINSIHLIRHDDTDNRFL
ncbi:hypothetical protein D1007_46980 [Hordeum vulgare]|nr:hypothetical protein D1007_46980 [Hordeum vulgare]